MSTFVLPSSSQTERALQRLHEAERSYLDAAAHHEREGKLGGARLEAARYNLARASGTYRRALLDPHLPPL